MTTLHTINNPELLSVCSRYLQTGDGIFLLEDGVYCARYIQEERSTLPANIRVFVLEPDLLARGFGKYINADTKLASYDDFVSLVCEYAKTINWY